MPKKKQIKKHKHDKFLIIIGAILIFITVLGAGLITWGNNILVPEGQKEKEQISSTYRGTLTPAFSIDLSKPFDVSVGTITYGFTAQELSSGIDLVDKVIHIENVTLPIQITFENNIIHVNATITDSNGQIIGKIRDNDWWSANSEYNPSIWDRNYNSYAFELKDENDLPVLQVLMGQQNKIEIGFTLLAQGIPYYFGLNGTKLGVTHDDYATIHSSTLFKYPSTDCLGELKNSEGYPVNNVFASANEKIATGNILSTTGTILTIVFGFSFGGLCFEELRKRRNKEE
jgi:hypothetical protein